MSIDTTPRITTPGAPDPAGGHDRSRPDVHVVGGGLAGLVAAAVVAGSGRTVTIHESRGRLGGRATTDERRGYRFNQGPHAFYRGGEGVEVLARLGIHPTGSAPASAAARMVRGGRAYVGPGSASTLARTRLLGVRDKAAFAAALARIPRIDARSLAGLTTAEWIDGLTDRDAVRAVLHATVRLASYVNGPDHLSADVAVMQLQRGIDKGVVYLDGGWQQLVDRLSAHPGVELEHHAPITSLDQLDGVDDGAAVIVAAGSPRSTAAITGHPYADGVEATASVLDLGLTAPPAHPFVIGVDEAMYLSDHGFPQGMVPPGAGSLSLAEYHPVTATPGGPRASSRDRLRSFAVHAGITDEQVVEERYLHRMVVVTSIATAATGGLEGRAAVAVPDRPGVFVAGDWVGRRGHLVDAVLASAEEAALATVAHLDRRAVLR